MRPFSLLISIFLFPLIAMFLFSCASPTDPYGKDKTTLSLVGIDSRQFTDTISIKDSVGNVFSVGFSSNLPMNLDSVELKLVVPDSKDSLLKTFYKLTNLKFSDISWNSMSFSDTGTKMIYGVAYINNYPSKIPSDTIKVIIYGKPPNFKPSITIAGLTTISIGQQFNLMVTATDTDKAQTITISLLKAPSGAVFSSAGLFLWTPPQDFFGTDTAIFIAKDNGYPIMSDTARVVIRVIDPSNNHAPKWQKDTINEVGRPGVPITVTLSDKCMDPDGDELTYSLLSGTPDGNAIVVTNGSAVYTFTPGPADTGALYSRMIAKDPKGASDTLTIALNIHVPGVDILPPIMKLVSPAGDSASVSSNALSIKIQCTDVSGVASVKCSMGVDTFTISNTDSTYTAAIVGLKSGLNIISFIATDASLSTNKDTFFVHIKYDSTIADNVAPIVRISSPSKDTVVGIDSCIIKIVSKDPSGVASVQWKIDAILFPATKSPTADSVWSATVKGLLPGTSTVTVIATDASPAANKDSAILHIKYDNDKTAPTLKLFSPAKDSASVSGNAIVIQVVCKDPSGVASITYGMGSGSPQPMTKSASADSLWSANVTDLVPGYNTIRIIAVDSTLTANRDTLLLHILYDTTTTTNPKPKITLDPVDQTVLAGQPDSFSVAATGAGTLGYQWQKNGTDITGETKTILKITAVSITDTGSYTCVVSNSGGKVTSKAARMTVQFSVSYDSNGKTGGAVPAGANYNFGATVTVAGNTGTLVRTGYTFAGWNTKNDGSGTSYAAAATFTMGPANVTLYAKWTQNVTFALTVTATNGSVTKVPDLTAYDSGTVVTLTPVPATGFHFTGWSGALTGSANPATITMNGAKSVTAGFTINAPNSFALTIVATNGTVTKSPDAAQYDSGTVVSLTAVPAPGYQFTGWSGGLTGTTNPGSITMTAAKSVTATFVFKQFVLTITATNGTVIKAPNAAQYDSGTVVTLTPVPAPGYQFTGWSGGLTGTANPGSITMTAAKSVTATFTINHYTVTFNSQGGSTVTSQTVNYGLLATAPSPAPTKACNTFVAWYLGTSPFSFSTPITSDITLLANWTPSVYTPTAAVTPSAPVCAGNNATFSATMFNGNAPYSYQWYKTVSGTPSPVGTNSSSLSIPTTAETGGATASYTITCYCTITDNCGKQATSSPANVTVYYLPAAPIVEFATDIDGILLHCSVMQQNASTYFCCYYQYNKNGTGWTPWSNTGGGNTCDGLQTYMENAQAQSDVIQFKAYTKNTLTNCVSATTTENWQP